MCHNYKFNDDPNNKNLALITAVSMRLDADHDKNYSCFAMDEKTHEMLHYAENTNTKISQLANCGIYYFSVRLFSEYGVNPYTNEPEH